MVRLANDIDHFLDKTKASMRTSGETVWAKERWRPPRIFVMGKRNVDTVRIFCLGIVVFGGWLPNAWAIDPVVCNTIGIPPSTPSTDFAVIGDGDVVRHQPTGLEWQRCSVGQVWDGEDCTGRVTLFTWQDALLLAEEMDGWRLPNISELVSIVEECRIQPIINEQVFPSTAWSYNGSLHYWSSTPMMQFLNSAWATSFEGLAELERSQLTSYLNAVRLVRDQE